MNSMRVIKNAHLRSRRWPQHSSQGHILFFENFFYPTFYIKVIINLLSQISDLAVPPAIFNIIYCCTAMQLSLSTYSITWLRTQHDISRFYRSPESVLQRYLHALRLNKSSFTLCWIYLCNQKKSLFVQT